MHRHIDTHTIEKIINLVAEGRAPNAALREKEVKL